MYYSHFGLAQPPFRITPDTDFFFDGANRGPILEALIYAIRQGEGIVKVTGEVGSGKTMLCNMLQARLPEHVETVYLANPSVSPEEILRVIACELELAVPAQSGRLETMQLLHGHLLERHAQGKQVVLFVEESQSMPLATLEEIRLLTNLETSRSKLLQIVLFGQPELDENLRQPQIRQLRDRITQSFRLAPLKGDEVGAYLAFRLRAAGYHGPDLFSPGIVKAIAKASHGLTRRINVIADKALLAAFADNTHTVKLKHVRAAVRDSEFDEATPSRPPLRLASTFSLLAIGAGAGIAIYAAVQAYQARFALPGATERAVTPALPAGTPPAREPAASPAPTARAEQPAKSESSATTNGSPPSEPASGTAEALKSMQSSATAVTDSPHQPTKPLPDQSAVKAPAVATPPPAMKPVAAPPSPSTQDASPTASAGAAPPPAASAYSPFPVNSGNILEARLAATKTWLGAVKGGTHSIQLLGGDNEKQLNQHLNVIAKSLEINDIFVYRTLAKQKPSLTVLYGSFENRRAALDAMAKLPPPLRAYRPYLRTVQGIRAELAQREPEPAQGK